MPVAHGPASVTHGTLAAGQAPSPVAAPPLTGAIWAGIGLPPGEVPPAEIIPGEAPEPLRITPSVSRCAVAPDRRSLPVSGRPAGAACVITVAGVGVPASVSRPAIAAESLTSVAVDAAFTHLPIAAPIIVAILAVLIIV